ncbi:hypothetical protein DENIS_0437 [Desulfonema ishimotonii]|uniref:histidine kinase n=1 Tax=Desulfonema ishimotonii TaxID=45657 RepID=A0A401FRA6_9BACT|nr:ATP-binding protein [Desulfonema ishimotonii]GBC59498.1 hypothetical protein DENIS_0437 [Desulfonema ishimotonii]
MADDKDKLIEKLQKRIKKLEAALKIVTTHSEKAENRMRKQFEVVAKTIPVPMIISTETGEIVFANPNAEKTFGYPPEEFARIRATALYANPDERGLFLDTLSDRRELSGFRIELRKSDGSVFPAVLFARHIDFDGQDAVLTIIHDLTEVMALEKQLRHTQKLEAIGTLTGGIAHDFNNILSVIFGYTEMVTESLDPEKNRLEKEYLDDVLKAARRAKSMIMQMMAFCRKSEHEKKPFRISAVVAEVVKLMGSLTPSDIRIRSDIRDRDMVVMGDPTQIHQVVTNLITNSVHALSDRGGAIDVILDQTDIREEQRRRILTPRPESGTYARITIRDNGPGISKDILDRIFDPFFTTRPVGQGSGMGLAVVHGIIRGHSGAVCVESEPGEGAAFHCYFPVIKEEDDNTKPETGPQSVGNGAERILFVDDELLVLGVYSKLLRGMGYRVTACTESRKALEIFKNQSEAFDLVITDNIMPEMSGRMLSKEILKIRPDIPIVLISGTLPEKNGGLKTTGIRTTIQKPFDRKKIQSVIREVLDAEKQM